MTSEIGHVLKTKTIKKSAECAFKFKKVHSLLNLDVGSKNFKPIA